jgi:hypothetical protein
MKPIPRGKEVDKAFSNVVKAVEQSLAELNQQAGRLMSQGQYDQAEVLAGRGREIKVFIQEIETFRSHWKALSQGSQSPVVGKSSKTPLWSYYQPILRALEALGGEGTRNQVMPLVEKEMASLFQPGDRDPMSGGKYERWQVMIMWSRKHLIQEGWIEPGAKGMWCITHAGRKAAKAELEKKR